MLHCIGSHDSSKKWVRDLIRAHENASWNSYIHRGTRVLSARVAMLEGYAYRAVGGHIEEAYLDKDKVILTHREGGKTCGVGERRTEDRRGK